MGLLGLYLLINCSSDCADFFCATYHFVDCKTAKSALISVRRIPPILWTKIRRELQEYFTEHEADGARVIVWAHKQVRPLPEHPNPLFRASVFACAVGGQFLESHKYPFG